VISADEKTSIQARRRNLAGPATLVAEPGPISRRWTSQRQNLRSLRVEEWYRTVWPGGRA
jgi:hypothetical protein